ncbi:MAG: hypothetical protein KAU20_06445 [Nanoarchaeota archaeon]|nr:hypothetical protein [Nanoarchaeota archaeon]
MPNPVPVHSGQREDSFLPTNGAIELTYTDGKVTEIKITAENGDYFVKTITYTDGVVTVVSNWVATYV